MSEFPATYILKVYNVYSKNITEHALTVFEKIHKRTGNILWDTKFYFQDSILESHDQSVLSGNISEIRKIIEPKGFRILVKCSDYDASQSGMQAEMTAGTMIYKMSDLDENKRPGSYDVLEESDPQSVVSLEEQKSRLKEIMFRRSQ